MIKGLKTGSNYNSPKLFGEDLVLLLPVNSTCRAKLLADTALGWCFTFLPIFSKLEILHIAAVLRIDNWLERNRLRERHVDCGAVIHF